MVGGGDIYCYVSDSIYMLRLGMFGFSPTVGMTRGS